MTLGKILNQCQSFQPGTKTKQNLLLKNSFSSLMISIQLSLSKAECDKLKVNSQSLNQPLQQKNWSKGLKYFKM